MNPIETSIARLLSTIREKSDVFEAQLEAAPKTQPCDRHPDQSAVLLFDASWKAGELVYGCGECAGDIQTRRRTRRIERAGIPCDVRHATLENFDTQRPNVNIEWKSPSQFLEAAFKFKRGETRNVLFCGIPGIGKGHLAGALAIEAIDAGEDVAWIDCAGLFSAYHQAYTTNETAEVIAKYSYAYLLVLDEICLRALPADGEEILFAIIDRRHKSNRRTIMLGNKPAKEVKEWIGGRIYDRLKSGGCLFRYGEWDSMRGKSKDGSGDEF